MSTCTSRLLRHVVVDAVSALWWDAVLNRCRDRSLALLWFPWRVSAGSSCSKLANSNNS